MKLTTRIRNFFAAPPPIATKPNASIRAYPTGAIATHDTFNFNVYKEYLPNPDKILETNNETIEVYRGFLYDAHVSSCVQSRKAGVMSMEWDINRGGKRSKEADFIRDVFDKLNFRQIFSDILDAPLYGFKPLEIYWREIDGAVVPVEVKGKPPWWFFFDGNNMLRFRDKSNPMGLLVPNKKFLCVQHNATYDNPYGEAILARCFYPVVFKKGGMKLWTRFAQKFGIPFVNAKMDIGTQEDAAALTAELVHLQQDGIIVTNTDIELTLLEAQKTTSSDIFLALVNFCNSEISKAILSQTLSTEQSPQGGSNALGQSHLTVRKDVIDSDKQLIEYWLNKLIEWVIEFNFGEIAEMPRFELYEEEDVDMTLAQRDAALAGTNQVLFTKEYFRRNYGFADDEIDIAGAAATPPAETTQPPPQFAEMPKNFNVSQFDEMTRKILKPIIELIGKGTSYSDIQDRIVELFPDLDTTAIEDYMAKGILIATGAGLLSGK
jgi:phage gp29-like protein